MDRWDTTPTDKDLDMAEALGLPVETIVMARQPLPEHITRLFAEQNKRKQADSYSDWHEVAPATVERRIVDGVSRFRARIVDLEEFDLEPGSPSVTIPGAVRSLALKLEEWARRTAFHAGDQEDGAASHG